MRRAIVLFGFVFTFVNQAAGAPAVDRCIGRTIDGRHWDGRAIHLRPWRKNRYGDRLMGPAFCVGRVRSARKNEALSHKDHYASCSRVCSTDCVEHRPGNGP